MAEDNGAGAAGAGAGGEDKGGAGASGAGAGGAQGSGAQGGAGGSQGGKGSEGGQGASGAGGDDSRSLAGGAGLSKDGKDGKGGQGDKGGDDAAKAEADKAARAGLEKEFAKDLTGKSDAEKKAFLDQKMAERAGKGKDGDGKDGAPAEYTNFTLPEGMELDAEAMTEFKGIARELNLSQDKAQKLVSLQAKIEKARADASVAEFDKTWKAWREETVKASGANFDKDQANVGRFIERFGSPELRKVMDATRVGENKHLFLAMAKAGELLAEGKLPEGDGAGAGKEDPAKRWFPKMRDQMAAGGAK